MPDRDLADWNQELDALRSEVDKLRCRIELARGNDRRRAPDRRLTPRQRPDRRNEHRGERKIP